jgi:hypothetical protein
MRAISIAVIASGVPLFLWWLAQQRIRYPWQGRPSENPRPGWLRRHELSAEEAETVARAVIRGEELDGERQRHAAAEWAAILLRTGRPHHPRTRRILVGLLIAWALTVATLLVRSAVTGHAGDFNWFSLLLWVGLAASFAQRRRKVRRALVLNSAPSGGSP